MPEKITPERLAASGSEHGHQAALFLWINENKAQYPLLTRLFAIPNGGLRNPATAGRLKAEGVKSGVPDVFLPVPRFPFHGCFIEMKVKKRKTFDNQDNWIEFLSNEGYRAVVCQSWEAARDELIRYITQ